jgi:hypothetical protein
MGAMHPGVMPALLVGFDVRKAAALTYVAAAMLTGIVLRHFRPVVC